MKPFLNIFYVSIFYLSSFLFSASASADWTSYSCKSYAGGVNGTGSFTSNRAIADNCVLSMGGFTFVGPIVVLQALPTTLTLSFTATHPYYGTTPINFDVIAFGTAPPEPKCTIPAGTEYNFSGTSGGAPDTTCFESCNFNALAAVTLGDGSWGGSYQSKGTTCTPPSGAPPVTGTPKPKDNCPSGDILINGSCYLKCSTNYSIAAANVLCGAPIIAPPAPPLLPTDPCIAAGTCTTNPGVPGTPSGGTTGGTPGGDGSSSSPGTGGDTTGGGTPSTTGDFVGTVDGSGYVSQVGTVRTEFQNDLVTLNDRVLNSMQSDSNLFNGLFTFAPVPSPCSPFKSSIHGIPVTIDICRWTELLRSVIAWLFGIYGAWTIFGIFFRART